MERLSVCALVTLCVTLCGCEPGRRPSAASDVLPVLDLVEPEGELYDPLPRDVDVARLRRILGEAFDPAVMSEGEPAGRALHPNGTVQVALRRTPAGHWVPRGKPPRHIRRMHLQHVRLGDGRKIGLELGNKMRRRFRDLLWLQSHCPLLRKWRDLGPRFWPRWFLEGRCAPRPTCSFPRGMTCRAHRSADKVLLRWHCHDWARRLDCDWLRVRYPLVTECRCGC